jgi:hypothetical protein
MNALKLLFLLVRSLFVARAALAAENLALRHQLVVLQRSVIKPRLRRRDRVFWVWLSRIWRNWRSVVVIVRPETVVRWHREGFRLYWRWRSRRRIVGRPKVEAEIQDLVRRMCRENSWGAPSRRTPPSLSPRCVRIPFVLLGRCPRRRSGQIAGRAPEKGTSARFSGSLVGSGPSSGWTLSPPDG